MKQNDNLDYTSIIAYFLRCWLAWRQVSWVCLATYCSRIVHWQLVVFQSEYWKLDLIGFSGSNHLGFIVGYRVALTNMKLILPKLVCESMKNEERFSTPPWTILLWRIELFYGARMAYSSVTFSHHSSEKVNQHWFMVGLTSSHYSQPKLSYFRLLRMLHYHFHTKIWFCSHLISAANSSHWGFQHDGEIEETLTSRKIPLLLMTSNDGKMSFQYDNVLNYTRYFPLTPSSSQSRPCFSEMDD